MTKVTINPPATFKVSVNNQEATTVKSINYNLRTINGSADLNMAGANTGDVIVYNANTNSFIVEPIVDTITDIDGGTF